MKDEYDVYLQRRLGPGRLSKPVFLHRTVGPKIPETLTESGRTIYWLYTNESEGYVTYGEVRP